jgi:hypothetical protein
MIEQKEANMIEQAEANMINSTREHVIEPTSMQSSGPSPGGGVSSSDVGHATPATVGDFDGAGLSSARTYVPKMLCAPDTKVCEVEY